MPKIKSHTWRIIIWMEDVQFLTTLQKPIILDGNNWLFSDPLKGAQASAVVYSIVEIAKANGFEIYSYLELARFCTSRM